MTGWTLIWAEMRHRKGRLALGLLSAALAAGTVAGAVALLDAHKQATRRILDAREKELAERVARLDDDVRKAMLGLGFNVVILPAEQNLADFHADDFAVKDMPEAYVTRLAEADIVTVQHLLPSLQSKVEWPELRRSVILIGTRGEEPSARGGNLKPLVQPVPPGTLVLGHELNRSLEKKPGDTVGFFGREYRVHRIHEPRGNKDDITVWMELGEAQELLGKKGRINAILAVECRCAWADLAKVREEIARILPDTQVIERASEALARAEARQRVETDGRQAMADEARQRIRLLRERERLAAILAPIVVLACALWLGLLAYGDVQARRFEIGVLRALGVSGSRIQAVFLGKSLLTGFLGGLLGAAVAFGVAWPAWPPLVAWLPILPAAPLLSGLSGWIPALMAGRLDPADILREG